MANIKNISLNGTSYTLFDATAVHTVDSTLSSSSTNPVQNKVVYQAIEEVKSGPYITVSIAFGVIVTFSNFSSGTPTTYSDLVASPDFDVAIRKPVIVDMMGAGIIAQGLILDPAGMQQSNHWKILLPDGIPFNGITMNGVEGDLVYYSGDGWILDNFDASVPGYIDYTDTAISNLSIVSTQVTASATESAAVATGDAVIFSDTDDSGKLKRMTTGFDTSNTSNFLRQDGTWAPPPSSEAPVARIFHGTCSTAAGTTAKVVTCPQFLASDLVTGAIVFVTFTATNSGTAANLTLNVNGTGAKGIKYMRNAAESNLPGNGYLRANMTYRFVYNGTYWVCDTDYDADTVTQLTYRTMRVSSNGGGGLVAYMLCTLDTENDVVPFNSITHASTKTTTYDKALTTAAFDPFRGILYYSGTTAVAIGSGRDANEFKSAVQFDCRYSLNINSSGTAGSTALTAYDPVYIKALYTASTRLAKLVADTSNSNYLVRSSVVQALPSADPNTGLADGTFYIYILLGQAYSKYQIDLYDNNTVYYWNTKAGMMTEFTGIIEADYATPADISTAINALDASASGLSVSKTITALLEQNGIISASAENIAIDASQVATGTFASNRIYSDATMATAIESGDSVIFADSSDENKVKRMSNGFDTTKTTEFLRRDGSWAEPSISVIKNDLTLLKDGTSPGDSHSLIFQRGTLTDNYNDWRIQDRGGFLYFDQRGSGSSSWGNMASINTSGTLTASAFSGSGASLTSLNASNISSGTLNAARLPSGLEYTSNMTQYVNSSSTTTEYPSAKAVYDSLDSITILTSDTYYGFSVDATPATGTLASGTVAQSTGNNLRDLLNSGKSVVIYDDDQIFDFDGNGYSLTFYATVDAGSFVSFRYFKDADGDTRDCELRITTSDTFAIYEVSYGGVEPVEDTSVFLSRTVNFGANKYKFPSLVGGTVAWNQLAALVASSWSKSSSVSISITGNTIRLTSTSATSSVKHASLPVVANHVYLSSGTVVSSTTTTSRFGFFDSAGTALKIFDNNTSQTTPKTGSILYKPTASTNVYALRLANAAAANVYADFTNIQLIDLTVALGSTIADYIYSLETATAGAGVQWFKQYFPKSFYSYNAGALVSVNPTGAQSGGYNTNIVPKSAPYSKTPTTGTTSYNSETNTVTFSFTSPSAGYGYIQYLSGNAIVLDHKYYMGAKITGTGFTGVWFKPSSNGATPPTANLGDNNYGSIQNASTQAYTLVGLNASSGTAVTGYIKDIVCVDLTIELGETLANEIYALEQATTGKGIERLRQIGFFDPHTYSISPVELRGIPKLSNGNLTFDGDVRESNGTVTRKYGQSALSALSWQKYTYQSVVYYIAKADPAYTVNADVEVFGYCTAYTVVNSTSYTALASGNIAFITSAWGAGATITVRDDSISSVSELVTKLTGKGEIVFKKKNPTTESSIALPVPQVVYDGGTESYIDERDVQMPVGQNATYMDATSAISELMDSGLVQSSGGAKESEGYFLVTDGVTSSDTWHYYKIGKQVTVSGLYTGTSSTATSLSELPFTPKYGLKFILPVMMISPAMMFYFCQVSITANSKTIGTSGHFSSNGSDLAGSWLNIGQIHSTPITFTYITDD